MSDMKDFVVFGAGKFGASVARSLSATDCQVIIIDVDDDRIQEIAGDVTYAVKADGSDIEVLKNLGVSNVDCAIVTISDNLESSVLATINCKELGVPYVIARASGIMHKKILMKVGADRVISPEKEMGIRLAKTLRGGNFTDLVEVSDDFKIVELNVERKWAGKTIRQLDLRAKYGINVIAVKTGDLIEVNTPPDMPLKEEQHLIVIGRNTDLGKIGVS